MLLSCLIVICQLNLQVLATEIRELEEKFSFPTVALTYEHVYCISFYLLFCLMPSALKCELREGKRSIGPIHHHIYRPGI